jgi:hypothetical protein
MYSLLVPLKGIFVDTMLTNTPTLSFFGSILYAPHFDLLVRYTSRHVAACTQHHRRRVNRPKSIQGIVKWDDAKVTEMKIEEIRKNVGPGSKSNGMRFANR